MMGRHNIIIPSILICPTCYDIKILSLWKLQFTAILKVLIQSRKTKMCDRKIQAQSHHLPVFGVLLCRPLLPYKQLSAVFHVRTLLVHSDA
jgi:hypothetical protein